MELQTVQEELYRIFDSDRVNVDEVRNLLSSYKSNPQDWGKYAKFDEYRYTRNLVDEGNGKFNLMILCWGEQHGSSIHDHSNAHCFVKVLDGQLMETIYEWPQDSEENKNLTKKMVNTYNKNGVAYINDSIGLHRMENPSHTDKCVTLHLYCPPFESCRIFDERTGHETKVKVTFWSKYGEKQPYKEESNGCADKIKSVSTFHELQANVSTLT